MSTEERDEHIMNSLFVAKSLARKFSILNEIDYASLYDIAEETIIRVYSSWNPARCKFSTFAWKCCEKALNNYVAKINYRRSRFDLVYLDEKVSEDLTISETIPDPKFDTFDTVENRMMLQKLFAYVVTMRAIQQHVFIHALKGYRDKETAFMLGINERYAGELKTGIISRLKIAAGI